MEFNLPEALRPRDAARAAGGYQGRTQLTHVPDESTVRLVLRCPNAWCSAWAEVLLFIGDDTALAELPEQLVRWDRDGAECPRCDGRRFAIEQGRIPGPFGPPPAVPKVRPTLPGYLRTMALSRMVVDVCEAQRHLEVFRGDAGVEISEAYALQILDEYPSMTFLTRQLWRIYALLRGLSVAPIVGDTPISGGMLAHHARRLRIADADAPLPITDGPEPDKPPPPPPPLPPRVVVAGRRPVIEPPPRDPASNPATSQPEPALVQELAQESIAFGGMWIQ